MTTEQIENEESGSNQVFPEYWSLSNNFIFVAILLLLATAVAVVVSSEEIANRLARYAYYSLVVGVLMRFVEQTVGDRLRRVVWPYLSNFVQTANRTGSELGDWIRMRVGSLFKVKWSRSGNALVEQVHRTVDDLHEQNVVSILKTTVITVFVGGVLQLFLWWQEPLTYVSMTYILCWIFAVVALSSAYFFLR